MFILITFLVLHGLCCVDASYYNVRYPQSKKTILGNVLTNSGIDMKTLKQLADTFPNHAIEIEIEGRKGEPLRSPNYRMNQPWLRENPESHQNSPDKIETLPTETVVTPSSTTPTTTMTTTRTMATTNVASSQITDLFNPQTADHQKRPLYMEDLIQALEDFEKKLGNKMENGHTCIRWSTEDGNRPLVKKDLWELQKSLNCNSNQESGSNEERNPAKAYHKDTPIRDFYDVVKLMKKGVKVQLEATTPADTSNYLNWIPIKIQKEVLK